jgi:hypothetical protein
VWRAGSDASHLTRRPKATGARRPARRGQHSLAASYIRDVPRIRKAIGYETRGHLEAGRISVKRCRVIKLPSVPRKWADVIS